MYIGQVAELVYALVLGTSAARLGSSSLPLPTILKNHFYLGVIF